MRSWGCSDSTHCESAHRDRRWHLHSQAPCTYCAAADACRGLCLHSQAPCNDGAPAHGRSILYFHCQGGSQGPCNKSCVFHEDRIDESVSASLLLQHIFPLGRERTRKGVGIPSGPVCLSMLGLARVGPNHFTTILQSSVGTPEGHSEVGVYLASFCVPN